LIVSGGNSYLHNFDNRLKFELINNFQLPNVILSPIKETRKYDTWIGGAILAGLSSYTK